MRAPALAPPTYKIRCLVIHTIPVPPSRVTGKHGEGQQGEESNFVTGQTIGVDAGSTMW